MTVAVKDLKSGDYVVPAEATVHSTDSLGGFIIVDFTDKTATAPIPGCTKVEIRRPCPHCKVAGTVSCDCQAE